MGDVEDPEIYCAGPILDWQRSEYGRWCKEHCVPDSITFSTGVDVNSYGYICTVFGDLPEIMYTFHQLKWSGNVKFN